MGEALPGAAVERVEIHPEYERYWLRYPDGATIPAEATRATPGAEGHCTAHDVTLYLREDLGQGTPTDAAAPMAALCARLVEHAPTLRARGEFVPGPSPGLPPAPALPRDTGRAVQLGPLHALLVGVGLLAAAGLRHLGRLGAADRRALGLTVVAGALAAASAHAGIFNGAGAAYEKIVLAWGVDVDSPYGEGFGVLHGPWMALFGRDPGTLFRTQRLLAAAAPPLLWGLVRIHADRRAALAAGLGLAGLPLLLRLGATELMHLPLTSFGLLAIVAGSGFRRSGDPLLAALALGAAGFAATVRPEATLLPLVVAGFALGGGARGTPVLVGLLVAGTIVRLAGLAPTQDVLRPGVLLRAEGLGAALLPKLVPAAHAPAGSTFWSGGFTPPALWPFALLGVVVAPAGLRLRLFGWWLLAEAPVLTKASPLADAARLQLPVQALWMVFVGLGAARLPTPGLVVAPALLGVAWFGAHPGWLRWANHAEFEVLRREVPTLGPEEVVLFDDAGPRAAKFARVMEAMGPARWVRASDWLAGGVEVAPTRWWRGITTDPGVEAAVRARCPWGAGQPTHLAPASDEDLHLDPAGVDVGFWHLGPCPPP